MTDIVYNVAGSYTVSFPSTITSVGFQFVAAGGGGAGSSATQGGGGGGGGGVITGLLTGLQPGSGIDFTVGLGGSGGSHGVGGGVGGSSFATLFNIIASGGRGGSIVGTTNGGNGGSGINPFGSIFIGASGSNGVSNGGNGGIANYFTSVAGAGGIVNVTQNGGSGIIGGGGGGASTSGALGTGRGGNGGDGYIVWTYTEVGTPVSGNCTLFIGQICGQSIYPSGDAGVSPSGYITNSAGSSGNLYSYINTDPSSSLSDTDYVRVSGVNSQITTGLPYIYYSTYNTANGDGALKRYNTVNGTVSTLLDLPASGTTDSGTSITSMVVDGVSNVIYYTDNFYGYIWKYNINTGAKTLVLSFAGCNKLSLDYYNKLLYFINVHSVLKCGLDGSNVTSVAGFAGEAVDITEDLPNKNMYILWKDPSSVGEIFTVDTSGTVNYRAGIYPSLSSGAGYKSFDIKNNILALTDGDVSYLIPQYSFDQQGYSVPTFTTYNGVSAPNIYNNIRIDSNTDNLYYVATSGANQILAFKNTKISSSGVLVATAATKILDFDFPRDLLKQTADFQLTSPSTSFGLNYPMVSDISVQAKAINSSRATFVNPQLLTSNRQTSIWYPQYGVWGVWKSGDGQLVNNIGPNGTTITPTYNNYNDISSSILRLDTYSVVVSGINAIFDLYSVKVKLSCSGAFTPGITKSGNCTLIVKAAFKSSGNTTCFIKAGSSFKTCTLYTAGKISSPSGCTLFIYNRATASGNIPLYIKGITGARSPMNMFIKAKDGVRVSGNCPLFIFASTKSGIYGHISCVVNAPEPSGGYPSHMNMVIGGQGSFRQTSNMNLFLQRDTYKIAQAFNLFTKNERSGINSLITLYMAAPSGTYGAVPVSGNGGMMNLYIARRSEGFERRKTLYISGPSSVTSNTTFYIKGTIPASSVSLYIKGRSTPSQTMELYTHGF